MTFPLPQNLTLDEYMILSNKHNKAESDICDFSGPSSPFLDIDKAASPFPQTEKSSKVSSARKSVLGFSGEPKKPFTLKTFNRNSANFEGLPLKCSRQPLNIIDKITVTILETFKKCDRSFSYQCSLNPKRLLTKPGIGVKNNGYDNENSDYILAVGDTIGNQEGRKFVIIDLLGHGTFGQVAKCQNVATRELVAVKVIKNMPAYFNQSMMEVRILELLNNKFDPEDKYHIAQMKDTFMFRNHLCIVLELLSHNLYELIRQNQHKGFHHSLIRAILAQLLEGMVLLNEAKIVHCDLKPENILLRNLDSPSIKIIDFGSACHEQQTLYTYIQSRFYRSPEVILGLPYSSAIDMWSLGCIAAELFLGLPIFPGASNYDQISRIVETIGMPPYHMLEVGKNVTSFFNRTILPDKKKIYSLKSREQYCREKNVNEPVPKRYISQILLADIINNAPMRSKMDFAKVEEEKKTRIIFLDFLKGLLNVNPIERWSPQQARKHPYLTGEPYNGPYVPAIMKPLLAKGKVKEDEDLSWEDDERMLYESDLDFESPYYQTRGRNPSRNQPNPSPQEISSNVTSQQRRSSAPSLFGVASKGASSAQTINTGNQKMARKLSVGTNTGRRMSVQHNNGFGSSYQYLSQPNTSFLKSSFSKATHMEDVSSSYPDFNMHTVDEAEEHEGNDSQQFAGRTNK